MSRSLRNAVLLLLGLGLALTLGSCATRRGGEAEGWRAGLFCGGDEGAREAARLNADGLTGVTVNVFGRPEQGWALYAPQIAETIETRCAPQTPAFAAALARWSARHGLPASGVVDSASLTALKITWQARRPFVTLRGQGICPDPPPDSVLAATGPGEDLGKSVRLRQRALWAYRRMVADARRDGVIPPDQPQLLALFSGYRDPAADAARCAAQANCLGLVRAACSAHRTGLALDLNLGSLPGLTVDNSADANRLFQTQTPAYRWLVRNAARYGFVNYVFEPWHWEWTGEAP